MRIRALAVAPLLLAVLAGCTPGGAPPPLAHYQAPSNGESKKTGPEVAKDAAAALLHAGAATVEGHLTADGADQDVTFNMQGSDLTGTVVTQGMAVRVIVWGGNTYAEGPAAFWRDAGLPEDAAARLAGRWVQHAETAVERLTPISLIWLADAVRDPAVGIEHDVHLGKADSGPLTGTPVAVVTLADGSTIQVAAAGTPYPLVVENPGGHDGDLALSAFEEGATVVPPRTRWIWPHPSDRPSTRPGLGASLGIRCADGTMVPPAGLPETHGRRHPRDGEPCVIASWPWSAWPRSC